MGLQKMIVNLEEQASQIQFQHCRVHTWSELFARFINELKVQSANKSNKATFIKQVQNLVSLECSY
jgi:hypothetical protein